MNLTPVHFVFNRNLTRVHFVFNRKLTIKKRREEKREEEIVLKSKLNILKNFIY